jgi:phage shock protein PspC (stress-responsive transcriptional regulator)
VIDPNIVRVLWVFGTFMSIGVGVLLYIILALILPEQIVATEDI